MKTISESVFMVHALAVQMFHRLAHAGQTGMSPLTDAQDNTMSNTRKTPRKTLALVASMAAVMACGLAASAAHAATTNGFANGGFEDATPFSPLPPGGNTSFANNWLSAPTGNPVMLSNDAHTGAHSALLSVPAGFGGSTLFQNSMEQGGLPALTAGDTPVFSFWAKGDASTTGNVLFNLRYLDGTGNILNNQSNNFFQGSINSSTWSQITLNGNVVPVGAQAAFLEINTAVGPLLDGRPNAVLVDDIYLGVNVAAAVPEPESYAMMLAGLGCLGLLARRRRV